MDFLNIAKQRFSVRSYTDQAVEKEKLDKILEAVFKTIMEREINPLIDLVYMNERNVLRHIISNISDINVAPTETVCILIDNLVRQGLIYIPDTRRHYADDSVYSEILNSPYYIAKLYLYSTTSDDFIFLIEKE